MKKIILLISTIVVIIAQVFVIGRFFINRYDIILNGDKIKFEVINLDISKAYKNGRVKFELAKKVSGLGDYGIIHEENGFAILDGVAVKEPSYGIYLNYSEDGYFYFPYDEYYLSEIIDFDENLNLPKDYKAYINVRLKGGKLELINLIVNDQEIEDYIQ